MTKEKTEKPKIKRLPPILYPFIWLLILLEVLIVRPAMYLVGFWRCKECRRTLYLRDDKFRIIDVDRIQKVERGQIKEYMLYKRKTVCYDCDKLIKEKLDRKGVKYE